MLDLINWIRKKGRNNDDLSTILEKFSEWWRALLIDVGSQCGADQISSH